MDLRTLPLQEAEMDQFIEFNLLLHMEPKRETLAVYADWLQEHRLRLFNRHGEHLSNLLLLTSGQAIPPAKKEELEKKLYHDAWEISPNLLQTHPPLSTGIHFQLILPGTLEYKAIVDLSTPNYPLDDFKLEVKKPFYLATYSMTSYELYNVCLRVAKDDSYKPTENPHTYSGLLNNIELLNNTCKSNGWNYRLPKLHEALYASYFMSNKQGIYPIGHIPRSPWGIQYSYAYKREFLESGQNSQGEDIMGVAWNWIPWIQWVQKYLPNNETPYLHLTYGSSYLPMAEIQVRLVLEQID